MPPSAARRGVQQDRCGAWNRVSQPISTATAQGIIRLNVPRDNEPPFYARISGYEFIGTETVFRTDEWAARYVTRPRGYSACHEDDDRDM
jgi:hypothetical protein